MSECQNYDGRLNHYGYGVVTVGKERVLAHRLAWAMHNGADPTGKVVMHSCDNPACVNPEHLSLGTPAQNSADMAAKGRSTRGTRNPMAKLCPSHVRTIRSMRTHGLTGVQVAKLFGVSQATISSIMSGTRWSWVPSIVL